MAAIRTAAKLNRFSPDELARLNVPVRACGQLRAGGEFTAVQTAEAERHSRHVADADWEAL